MTKRSKYYKMAAKEYTIADAMPYLELDAATKAKEQAAPFDAKKSVWVPAPKGDTMAGYLAAIVENADGDNVEVKTMEGGNVRHYLSFIYFIIILKVLYHVKEYWISLPSKRDLIEWLQEKWCPQICSRFSDLEYAVKEVAKMVEKWVRNE